MARNKQPKANIVDIVSILNNKASKAKLQNFIDEAVRCKQRIADENESIKAIVEEGKDQIGVEPKVFKALVNLYFKNNFAEKKAELESLDMAIDMLMMNKVDGDA